MSKLKILSVLASLLLIFGASFPVTTAALDEGSVDENQQEQTIEDLFQNPDEQLDEQTEGTGQEDGGISQEENNEELQDENTQEGEEEQTQTGENQQEETNTENENSNDPSCENQSVEETGESQQEEDSNEESSEEQVEEQQSQDEQQCEEEQASQEESNNNDDDGQVLAATDNNSDDSGKVLAASELPNTGIGGSLLDIIGGVIPRIGMFSVGLGVLMRLFIYKYLKGYKERMVQEVRSLIRSRLAERENLPMWMEKA